MSIDVSRLQVTLEEGERWRRTLNITIPSEIVQAERHAAMKRLSSKLKLPGFRAGRIPAAVLEKRFGPAVDQELLDRVIGEAYRGVLREQELRPISEGEVGEVEYRRDEDLTFQVSFDVAPRIELARLGGFQVRKPASHVSDEDVDKVLQRIREQHGTWVPAGEGSPQGGDRVSVTIEQLEDEEAEPRPYEFVLGEGEAIPQIEEAIRTLEAGATGEFTISVPAEEGADAPPPPPRSLRIHLDGFKRLELPELDDALAGRAGDFESLEELRVRIREDLEREAESEAESQLRGMLLEQVVGANPFEVPESMVDQYLRAALGNREDIPEERFREAKEQLGEHAVRAVQRHLVIRTIAESRELRATEEEVDRRIEEIAERNGRDPGEVYGHLQKSGRLDELEQEITERKVFDFLKQESTITDAG